jgi:hypothetical protein
MQAIATIHSPSATAPEPGGGWSRPSANFVAHLIATAQNVPQTRSRRRAEPDGACAAYAAAAAHAPVVTPTSGWSI